MSSTWPRADLHPACAECGYRWFHGHAAGCSVRRASKPSRKPWTRDQRNLHLALVAEWGVGSWLGIPGLGDLPPSALRVGQKYGGDGGVDLRMSDGRRVDVKASDARYPELMVPVAHEAKFRRAPVDVLLKAIVEGSRVTITCWEDRARFLDQAHRDDGTRYPIPTLWLRPSECNRVEETVDVPGRVMDAIGRFIDGIEGDTWNGWLTL